MNLFKHNVIISERRGMVKITETVKKDILESGIKNGIVVVHCPVSVFSSELLFRR